MSPVVHSGDNYTQTHMGKKGFGVATGQCYGNWQLYWLSEDVIIIATHIRIMFAIETMGRACNSARGSCHARHSRPVLGFPHKQKNVINFFDL